MPPTMFGNIWHMSHDMRFPTMWNVRHAKAQTRLRIREVWSEPLLVAWISYDSNATDRTSFGVSKFQRGLHRLIRVYTSENAKLLEITYRGSYGRWCHLQNFKLIAKVAVLDIRNNFSNLEFLSCIDVSHKITYGFRRKWLNYEKLMTDGWRKTGHTISGETRKVFLKKSPPKPPTHI